MIIYILKIISFFAYFFASSFDWDTILGVLFGVLGVFFGVVGVFILWINYHKTSPFCVLCGKGTRARLPHQNLVRHLKNLWHAIWELCNCCKPVLGVSAWTKKWIHIQKRSPVGPRYPDGDPFGNNASLESLFWVSICSSAACFPGSGRKEELGKMEEPGLNFCRARFAIVLWTFCDFFQFFCPWQLTNA